ncbi:hypothetical protein DACRYDRAFT_53539 [Dacryopinax primogenitus]|uniref:DUF4218 domain-containing protein n=1 Tax=Dacryopinax primogenitus (strain DJM 731) TaxID=1858805 RepID=M5GAE4_DACPD|nr:uncharacterized protein DACRYDRAFT_53539 [Dacryopinax primogenitus]EJU00878.1 hypothetical protein DACRYDRAFT_53539 [Dacryopinax primogenitus]
MHLASLSVYIDECLTFSYPPNFSTCLRNNLAEWVLKYEALYFKGQPACIGLCLVTIHSLLHIADCIEWVGPIWSTWAFPIERFCGLL